ncbi:hypothetical protein FPV67DRAFT_996194 [Lyophyllum atratum]|nr:hypothetical protein FPV67DRAFT_996194 [Lyophyllum atratum]
MPSIQKISEVYFNACIFEALLLGIYFAVFVVALATIYNSPKRAGQPRWAMSLVTITLFVLVTADMGAFWAYVGRAFIAHGETAESIGAALDEYPVWFLTTKSYSDTSALLADSVLIWRTWVIWGKSWKITVVPVICTMLTLAFSIISTYETVTATTFGVLRINFVTGLYAATLVTTIFCTGAIIYRVVQVGGLRPYRGLIEILIESSALYCVATIFALVSYLHSALVYEYAFTFWIPVTGIAPTLVIARVAAGHARPNEIWMSDRDSGAASNMVPLSHIKFGASGRQRSAHEIGTVVSSHAGTESTLATGVYGQGGSMGSVLSAKPGNLDEEYYKPGNAV